MMRSMFTAITGLDSHRTAIDVVGHNLANVNTVGYKKQRAYFEELFSQKLAIATAPTATRTGRNPAQVGLGVRIASIDTIFTQGSVETTGKSTDLSINGKGFFILKYGKQTFFTRAGNFDFDSTGMLVDPNGYRLQGYKFNETTGEWEPILEDIYIDPNDRLAPKQTDIIKLKANLSAGATGNTYETWSIGPFRNSSSSTIESYTSIGTTYINDSCMAEDLTTGDYLDIRATGHDGESITGKFYFNTDKKVEFRTNTGAVTLVNDDYEEFSAGTTISSIASGEYVIVVDSNNDKYKIGQIIKLESGMTFTASVTVRSVSSFEDLFLYLNYIFNGKYEDYSSSVTLDSNNNYHLERPYANGKLYRLEWRDGKIWIIDKKCGDSLLSINMQFIDYGSSGSKMDLPDITKEVEGKFADRHVVATKIYDKFGNEHEIRITYVKVQGKDADDNASFFGDSEEDNPNVRKDVWIFYTELDGKILEVNGATGRVEFDQQGNPTINYYYARFEGSENEIGAFESITATGTVNPQLLDLCPDENCPVVLNMDIDGDGIVNSSGMKIATLNEHGAALGIHLEEFDPDLFEGPVAIQVREGDRLLLTNLGGESKTYYIEQNGYPQGELSGIEIDDNGVVYAIYTNEQIRPKYRIALAGFANEQGLERAGDNLFKATPASGNPYFDMPGEGGLGSVKPGTLEMSNVDIAEEFTKMILFQRGFQANARVITTSDEMLQDIIALKR